MTNDNNNSGRNLWFLVVAASVSSLGGFLFGYDNIVISGAIEYLTKSFHLDDAGKGWAAGCALVGCLAGGRASRPVRGGHRCRTGESALVDEGGAHE